MEEKKLSKLEILKQQKQAELKPEIIDDLINENQERKGVKFVKALRFSLISTTLAFIAFIYYEFGAFISNEFYFNINDLDTSFNILNYIVLTIYDVFIFLFTNPEKFLTPKNIFSLINFYLLISLPFIVFFYFLIKYTKEINKFEIGIIGGLTNFEIRTLKYVKPKNYLDLKVLKGKQYIENELLEARTPISYQFNKDRVIIENPNELTLKYLNNGGLFRQIYNFIFKPFKNTARFNFLDRIPNIHDGFKPLNETALKRDRLYLGCDFSNIIYTEKETAFRGKIPDSLHFLIVGTSGSGKSTFFNNFLANWLNNEEDYKELETIKIADLKNGGDYQDFKEYDKIEVVGSDTRDVLAMFKEMDLIFETRSIYIRENGLKDGRTLQKVIFVIDEAQTILAMEEDRNLSNIERQSWIEISNILRKLTAKARFLNISIVVILQQALTTSLSSNVRSNLKLRVNLLNDNTEYLLNGELIKKNDLKPDDLTKGQFYFYNDVNGDFKPAFARLLQCKSIKLNKENDSKEDKAIRADIKKLTNIFLKQEEIKLLEEAELEGQNTYFDTHEQLISRDKISLLEKAKEQMEQETENLDLFEARKKKTNQIQDETKTLNKPIPNRPIIEDTEQTELKLELAEQAVEIHELENKINDIAIDEDFLLKLEEAEKKHP